MNLMSDVTLGRKPFSAPEIIGKQKLQKITSCFSFLPNHYLVVLVSLVLLVTLMAIFVQECRNFLGTTKITKQFLNFHHILQMSH